MAKNGFIQPVVPAKAFDALDQFAIVDLDAFLGRLFDGAHSVRTPKSNQLDIPSAASRCCCSSVEVLRLILNKQLNWVGRQSGVEGYMSARVNVDEVRSKVRGADHGGFTGIELKDKLSITSNVASALIKAGHLKTITVINPVNRCPTVVVPLAEAERFQKEYVSLFTLSRQCRKHFRVVKKALQADGVEPVFDPKKIGATFYRRAIVSGENSPFR